MRSFKLASCYRRRRTRRRG